MEVFKKIKVGNERFVRRIRENAQLEERFVSLSKSQNPHTIVLTCSDSRVVPEYIFDWDLGELFVVRTAGNVVDVAGLGSIEFAVSSFDIKQIIILGHTNCGAIKQAYKGLTNHTNIDSLLGFVIPITEKWKQVYKDETEIVSKSIVENVKQQKNEILKSTVVNSKFQTGELAIFLAIYDLETGKVEFFDEK
ncbi:MAG: carbonic anhydrase [Candidatus Kapaibacteriota bacterium]